MLEFVEVFKLRLLPVSLITLHNQYSLHVFVVLLSLTWLSLVCSLSFMSILVIGTNNDSIHFLGGACDDQATTPNTGFYSLRATTFCNQCLALAVGVTSCGVQPAVLSLPACPVVVS